MSGPSGVTTSPGLCGVDATATIRPPWEVNALTLARSPSTRVSFSSGASRASGGDQAQFDRAAHPHRDQDAVLDRHDGHRFDAHRLLLGQPHPGRRFAADPQGSAVEAGVAGHGVDAGEGLPR